MILVENFRTLRFYKSGAYCFPLHCLKYSKNTSKKQQTFKNSLKRCIEYNR